MARVLVAHGPNLSRLGSREPEVYGTATLADIESALSERAGSKMELSFAQTDDEATLVGLMHTALDTGTHVILNPAVVEFQHVKPGKGGAFVRTKMKNVRSGKVVDKTFNAGTKVDFAVVDRRDYTFLYEDGADYVFMDQADFDQVTVPGAVVGDAANFMLGNQPVTIAMHEGEALYIDLPASVVLEITYSEPGLQGDRSTGGTKPATLETGFEIQVPLFVEQGTKCKVDTRTGEYLGRVSDE